MTDGLNTVLGFFFLLACSAAVAVGLILHAVGAHPVTALGGMLGL